MALFNQRTLRSHLQAIDSIPSDHASIVGHWASLVRSDQILGFRETALDGDFKARLLENVLGYRPAGHPEGQTVAAQHPIGSGRVDLALGHFNGTQDVVAPFELKGAATRDLDAPMPGRNISPVEQAWAYALAAGRSARWVLVTNYVEIRLYSYRDGNRDFERFDVGRLDELDEYQRFIGLLSADNLLGGTTLELLQKSISADKAIGEEFYADYQQLREMLITEIAGMARFAAERSVAIAQTILDRILFIAFAEDRQLLPTNLLSHTADARNTFNPQPVWENFKGLFRLIDGGGTVDIGGRARSISAYNGGLFRRDPEIQGLDLSDSVCSRFKALGAYDFNGEVDVPILGRIFEQSLRDLEKHLAIARGETPGNFRSLGRTPDRIKKDGIVYTPPFVAQFITERTIGTHVRELFERTMAAHAVTGDPMVYETLRFAAGNAPRQAKRNELAAWRAFSGQLRRLRVVDPACGSGIFLVTAFDVLKREYDRVNAKIVELAGQPDLFDIDAEILANNLYGVDVNAESVEITKLSLWLKTAKGERPLDSLEGTLKVGDSLIEDHNYAYLRHGFTWQSAFPDVFEDGGFDVVLGNPPYVRMELIKAMKPYLEKRYAVVADRADLYAYFYERGLRLLKPGGRLGFISNNTFMKTGSGRPLRDYLRQNAAIEEVADFGDVQIFEGVTTYPVIIVARSGAPDPGHELAFWDVPEVPADDFGTAFDAAAQPYPQASLGSGSWELEGASLRALREKIMRGHPTLREVYGAPLYGIKTGLNAAFVIDRATRDRLVAADPRSKELLRPWLEGKDLRRWRAEPRDLFVIYIPKNRIEIEDYPAIRDHLLPFRSYEVTDKSGKTELRGLTHRATDQQWFELQQAQEAYVPALERTKIAYRDVADECAFFHDHSGSYVDSTCFFISTDEFHLLGLLNSRLVWFLMAAITPEFRGGFARFKSQFVGSLPVPSAIRNDDRIAIHAQLCTATASSRSDLQRSVTRRIPDLVPPNRRAPDGSVKLGRKLEAWWTLDFPAFRDEVKRRFKTDIPLADRTDWETWLAETRQRIAELSAENTRAEAEINAIVYHIFGLTPEEIALLEASVETARTP